MGPERPQEDQLQFDGVLRLMDDFILIKVDRTKVSDFFQQSAIRFHRAPGRLKVFLGKGVGLLGGGVRSTQDDE